MRAGDKLLSLFGLQRKPRAVSVGPVERRGAKKKGTLISWVVNKLSRWTESQEREDLTSRAQDLTANHPHATSCIESLATNVVGTGLNPQSQPQWQRLGITESQAREFSSQAEWVWSKWCAHADLGQRLHFNDIQFLAAYSLLMNGEYLILPTMKKDAALPGESRVRLALQALNPVRLATPADLASSPDIRDGVRLGGHGEPRSYFVATPKSGQLSPHLTSSDFTTYPARIGHRPGVLHSFSAAAREPDRVRGVSVLAPAMKFFRDLSDYLDFELVGNIVASSFPVFIEKSNPAEYMAAMGQENAGTDSATPYQEFEPGGVYYGREGEKPHILKPERPSNTFDGFVETILRSIGASCGLPYEVVAKDFSKTNYSSARAALLEAWRVYMLHRTWLERHLCQPVWTLVLEEAWLRGELQLPSGGPDFYEAMAEYTAASWIGPAKGHVDPLKETHANVLRLNNDMTTLAKIHAEEGEDWEAQIVQRGREQDKIRQTMPQQEEQSSAGTE